MKVQIEIVGESAISNVEGVAKNEREDQLNESRKK